MENVRQLKWSLPILSLMTLYGCGTKAPIVLSPEAPPRPKPVEAMVDCGPLPLLADNLPQMKVEGALKEVLSVKFKGDELFVTCALRHNELIRWINEE